MTQSFTSKVDYLEKLKLHHLTVSDEVLTSTDDGSSKSIYNQRFIITVNNAVTWRGGTVALGNQSAYITISKERMKQLDVHVGDEVKVTIEKDQSKYGFEVPEEFEEVLRQDEDAKKRFDQLRMGLQRAIIYLVIQYKTVDKRIEKSMFFMENLKNAPIGNENMRHILGKE
jgi:antitoxin component of MazEF toxin-antitoxin module